MKICAVKFCLSESFHIVAVTKHWILVHHRYMLMAKEFVYSYLYFYFIAIRMLQAVNQVMIMWEDL